MHFYKNRIVCCGRNVPACLPFFGYYWSHGFRFFVVACCLFFLQKGIGQNFYFLKLQPIDKEASFLKKNVKFKSAFPDSISLVGELKSILFQLQGKAYLEASVDSLAKKDSLVTAFLFVGKQYKWANLSNGNIELAFLDQVGFRERLYQKKPFNYLEIRDMQEKLLDYGENNGFPFASVWLDSLQIEGETIAAQIFMKKGKPVFLDSINVEGEAKISDTYLKNYLGLKEGSLYSKSKVLKVRNRLRELPFLKETRNANITFEEDKATVNLYLEKKKASRFDFLIGVLPGSSGGSNQSSLLLTGNLKAEMHNQFGLGEKIFFSFDHLRPETQELALQFAYPYILNLPFGIDLKFNQFKLDTTYSNVAFDFGVQYLFEGGNYLKAFWNNAFTNVLTVDTLAVKRGKFPSTLDVSNSSFGLEFSWQKLDYRFNPRRGWSIYLRGGAGFKKIRRNQSILKVNESFYDTLNLKTFQYKLDGRLAHYFPLRRRSAIKTALEGGVIISEKPIYQNEQYRIGGNRLLRGFDEESIFSTLFTVLTLESRFLLNTNSFFYLFGDFAYTENRTATQRVFDKPFGFGLGTSFETSAGIFGISMAVGSQQGNALDFRNPKIHFGYISLF